MTIPKAHLFVGLLTLSLIGPSLASARDCPNMSSGYMWAIGDSLELGAEFRAFYFGISVGGTNGARRPGDLPTARLDTNFTDDIPGERAFENNVFLALRPLLYWYPADGLTVVLENEVRFRWPGWEENSVPGLNHRLVSAFIEFENNDVTLAGGIQPFTFGSGAIIDQRFIGISASYDHSIFNIATFGGMTMRNIMRNAGNSMWMSYITETNGWKFLSRNPTENWGVGLTFSLKTVRPFRLQLLYLFTNPSVRSLQSHAIGIHFAGPIVRRYLSFVLEPLLLMAPDAPDGDLDVMPAAVAEVRARLGSHDLSPDVMVGGASSFLHDYQNERRFVSAFENLSWGLIRRFNLEQGHVFYARVRWNPLDNIRVFADYTMAFPNGGDSLIDELDVGAWFQVNDLYRLRLAYVGLNLASDLEMSHGAYAELRIVIGPQP